MNAAEWTSLAVWAGVLALMATDTHAARIDTHEATLSELASIRFPLASKPPHCLCNKRGQAVCIHFDAYGREDYRQVIDPRLCERKAPGTRINEHR